MTLPAGPDYTGGSLLNLVAELEFRLTGSAASPRLRTELAPLVPDGRSIVLVVFDGLGSAQLEHRAAATLRATHEASIDAPFPTTTTVSLATIATGLAPIGHGLLGYQLWMPPLEVVANTIKWTTLWGDPLDYDTTGFLPAPNLWERLAAAGAEAITVQPEGFRSTALTRLLYRGCRFDGVETLDELIDATVTLASAPDRLVVAYVANVDYAAHVYGQKSDEYDQAIGIVDYVWSKLLAKVPSTTALVGTADHGHVDFPSHKQVKIARSHHDRCIFYGDGRAMFVKGDGPSVATELPARWVTLADMRHWWGDPTPHTPDPGRLPDGVLLADDGYLLLHKHSDDRMIGNHGGLTPHERTVPLLLRSSV